MKLSIRIKGKGRPPVINTCYGWDTFLSTELYTNFCWLHSGVENWNLPRDYLGEKSSDENRSF